MSALDADDWHDAADLFEQGAVQAENSYETHSAAACKYAVARLNSLAMWATGKAIMERERARSPRKTKAPTPDESRRTHRRQDAKRVLDTTKLIRRAGEGKS